MRAPGDAALRSVAADRLREIYPDAARQLTGSGKYIPTDKNKDAEEAVSYDKTEKMRPVYAARIKYK